MITDSNVEEVRRVRQELIKQHGGLDGYMKYLQATERGRGRIAKRKSTRQGRARAPKNGHRGRRRTVAKAKA